MHNDHKLRVYLKSFEDVMLYKFLDLPEMKQKNRMDKK